MNENLQRAARRCLMAGVLAGVFAGQAAAQNAFPAVSQAEWGKVLSAARTEGKVIVYGGPTAQTGAQYKAAFEKQYPGMTLEYTRLFGQQLMVKLEQERNGGLDGADFVISPELPWIADEARKNAFKAPSGPANAAWPARFVASGVAPLLALEPFIMAVNTNLVKTPVTGYADLLRPEFKGRIGIVEPVAAVLIAWYDWLEKTQGADFLSRIAAQSPRIYVTALPMTQATIGGEIAFAAFTTPSVLTSFIRQGAPVKMIVPSPSVGTAYAGVVLAWAKRPNAALVYMDFMMSPAGQSSWAGSGEVASPLGVPGSLDAKTVNYLDPSKYGGEVTKAFEARFRTLFKGK
jgi:iron(III) transport system substrate-binding protein